MNNKICRLLLLLIILIALFTSSITGYAYSTSTPVPDNDGGLSATRTVVNGSITGTVLDINDHEVPDVKVSLYICVKEEGKYRNKGLANISNNPQYSGDGERIKTGAFSFKNIPAGIYNLTFEKDGKVYNKVINVIKGNIIIDFIMPDYIYSNPDPTYIPTKEPTIIPKQTPTPVPTIVEEPTADATIEPEAPGHDVSPVWDSLGNILKAALCIQFITGIIMIGLYYLRKI